jgi:hypothetical protein
MSHEGGIVTSFWLDLRIRRTELPSLERIRGPDAGGWSMCSCPRSGCPDSDTGNAESD